MKKIEVITGPMFCGKSEELIRRVKREVIANRKVLVVKPKIDNRYSEDKIVSHDGRSIDAIVIDDPHDIYAHTNYDVFAIDEIQFFKTSLFNVVEDLNYRDKRVILAGLDKDYMGEPFHLTCRLMGIAHKVDKLTAVCAVCGEDATETFLTKFNKVELVDDNPIFVGGPAEYQARCRTHFRPPLRIEPDGKVSV